MTPADASTRNNVELIQWFIMVLLGRNFIQTALPANRHCCWWYWNMQQQQYVVGGINYLLITIANNTEEYGGSSWTTGGTINYGNNRIKA